MYIILLYIYFNKRNEISERFDIFFTYSICKTILRLIWIFMYSLSCLNYELKTYVISWDNYLLIYSIKSRTSIHKSVYNQKTLYTDCIIISIVFCCVWKVFIPKKKICHCPWWEIISRKNKNCTWMVFWKFMCMKNSFNRSTPSI